VQGRKGQLALRHIKLFGFCEFLPRTAHFPESPHAIRDGEIVSEWRVIQELSGPNRSGWPNRGDLSDNNSLYGDGEIPGTHVAKIGLYTGLVAAMALTTMLLRSLLELISRI
jgi:hypothetical protein